MNPSCLMSAWQACERELHAFLRHRAPEGVSADDLLQDLFLKALLKDRAFCEIENPRAWLFEVARNLVHDQLRRKRDTRPVPDDLPTPEPELDIADGLVDCLPRVLSELAQADREVIELCDLGSMTQAQFAQIKALSLPAAKSRIQRARQRLRAQLIEACQVRFDDEGRRCCFTPRARV